jgi:uncharacterized protein YjbI with pentapeptide repeats
VDADLTEVTSNGTVFEECDFSGAKLNASTHDASGFLRCLFRRTSLFGATLRECKLTGSRFEHAVLRPLVVAGGDWSYVTLRQADLAGIALTGLRLREADLTEADLTEADLRDCDLSHARLHNARLARADLRGADLTAVPLAGLRYDATVLDPDQAVQLTFAMGAVVQPR